MKIRNLFIFLFAGATVMLTTQCEGPAGEAGNSNCVQCHSEENWGDIETAYLKSGHNAAEAVGYAGGRGSCARCHSHEGFMNYLAATPGADAADIDYPTRISCSTCHTNHSVLEGDIEVPLATVAAVVAVEDDETRDLGGNSNLCGNCHQSRRGYAYYEALDTVEIDDVKTAVGDGNVGINSSHAGPHHGPQLNTLLGLSGYGASETHAHSGVGCVGCHMGDVSGDVGGHTFYANRENCTECHSADYEFENFDSRMTAIADALVTVGALSKDAETGEYHPHVSIVTQAQFEAFWNYMILYEDHSHGVHNPAYFKTLMSRAEANLGL